jgi:hypothetical protein
MLFNLIFCDGVGDVSIPVWKNSMQVRKLSSCSILTGVVRKFFLICTAKIDSINLDDSFQSCNKVDDGLYFTWVNNLVVVSFDGVSNLSRRMGDRAILVI